MMILKELIISAGFELVTDCLDPANGPSDTAYLIAQKPAYSSLSRADLGGIG